MSSQINLFISLWPFKDSCINHEVTVSDSFHMWAVKKKKNYTDNYQTPTFIVICMSTHLASQVMLVVKSPPANMPVQGT